MTGPLPAHRPTGSALHGARAGVGTAYCAAPALAAVLLGGPLALTALLAAVVCAGLAAGVGAELRRAAMFAVPLAVLVALVNPLVSREGLTVVYDGPLVPLLGNLDVTAEAVAYGAVAGLRVVVLVLASALFSAAVDPDELLALARRVAPRSALTASLATRLVPLLARDAERLSAALALRAEGAHRDAARGGRVRRAAVLTRALGANALERSVDVAAALEVRGYAAVRRVSPGPRAPWSRHDRAFAAGAATVVAIAIAGLAGGLAGFDPYPLLHVDTGIADLALAAALPAAMLAPFAAARRQTAHAVRLGGAAGG